MTLQRFSSLVLPLALLSASGFAQAGPLQLISLKPPSGSGNGVSIGLTASDFHGGADVSQVGIYIAEKFDGADASNACLAYYQRDTDRLFLAGNRATDWSSGGLREGKELANDRCSLSLRDSRVTFSEDRVTVHFAIAFTESFRGNKLVYAYANSFGDSRNTGWKEAGSWKVTSEPAPSAEASWIASAGVDPNDLATKLLSKPATPYERFLAANAGVTELKHQPGQLRFQAAGGRRIALVGALTHRDKQSGEWRRTRRFSPRPEMAGGWMGPTTT